MAKDLAMAIINSERGRSLMRSVMWCRLSENYKVAPDGAAVVISHPRALACRVFKLLETVIQDHITSK